jgi:hypothetical protein
MDLKETGCDKVDWNHLPPETDQWRVLVNVVINLICSIKGKELPD